MDKRTSINEHTHTHNHSGHPDTSAYGVAYPGADNCTSHAHAYSGAAYGKLHVHVHTHDHGLHANAGDTDRNHRME